MKRIYLIDLFLNKLQILDELIKICYITSAQTS